MIKLRYGLTLYNGLLGYEGNEPVQWFDTLEEAKLHVIPDKHAEIAVYAGESWLTRISYMPFGIAQGYHYFGIHPAAQAIVAEYGITDDMILGKVPV